VWINSPTLPIMSNTASQTKVRVKGSSKVMTKLQILSAATSQ